MKISFLLSVLLIVFLFVPASFGKMAAMELISANQVEDYLAENLKAGDPTARLNSDLVKVGRESLKIEDYKIVKRATLKESLSSFSIHNIRSAWSFAISARPKWDHQITPAAKAMLIEKREDLNILFKGHPYESAWVLNATGDSKGAKALLKETFLRQHEQVMKMDKAISELGKSPLYHLDLTWKALFPLSSASERRELEEKMKKAQIHISNLPQVHVLT